jgi:HK97 gp10 family phage protein
MIEGWDKLQAQLKAIAAADYTPALEKGVREAILPEMQALTRVDEGDLLASEDVVRENNSVSLVAGTDHAVHVEFGTVHQVAQPFMRPAIDTKKDAAIKVAAKEAETIMKKAI